MAMQLILTHDVTHLGKAGDVVNVKPGYGRNYLLPQGLAVLATRKSVNKIEHEKKVIETKIAKERTDAEGMAARLNGMTLQFERLVGDDDKLFGSVTTRDIEEALAARGQQVDRKKIHLAEPLKHLGEFEVQIKVAREVTATIKVAVVAKS